jgi:hypothetical protein
MPVKFCGRVIRGCRVALLLVAAATAFGPATGQAFTLITPTTKLFVNPAVGYTTSLVQVRATFQLGGSCPTPPTTFKFSFAGAPLWTKAVSSCNAATFIWDTGWSAYIKPPVQVNAGKYVIGVVVYLYTGATCAQGCSAQFSYTAVNPRPSPVSQPSPSPPASASPDCATGAAACASPTTATSPGCPAAAVTAVCPSPSAKACPAAMLPNSGTGGWGDNAIAALMVGSALPIAGLALFGPGPLWAFARRRRKLLVIFGLSMLMSLMVSCTFPAIGQGSTPSPSASPSTVAVCPVA